jgi:hypothetical protein
MSISKTPMGLIKYEKGTETWIYNPKQNLLGHCCWYPKEPAWKIIWWHNNHLDKCYFCDLQISELIYNHMTLFSLDGCANR